MSDDEFKLTVVRKLEHIETKIANYDKIEEKVNDSLVLSKECEKRLDKLDSQRKWYFTTIVGCVITIVITSIKNLFKIN